jgi:hypothetical protein
MTEPPQPADAGRPADQEPQHDPSVPPQGSPGQSAQPGPVQPPGWAVRATWTPAQRAANKLKDGLVFAGLGIGLVLLTCVGLSFMVGHDFFGVKFLGFLALCLLALGLFGLVLGIFWIFQGTYWRIKARRQQ